MRILLICWANAVTPMRGICLKIGEELAKDNEVHLASVVLSFSEPRPEKTDWCDLEFLVLEHINDPILVDFEKNGRWGELSALSKIRQLLLNPKMIMKIISKEVEKKYRRQIATSRIRHYCDKNHIDVIIAFTNPYDIFTRVIYNIPNVIKCVFQGDPFSTNAYTPSEKRGKYIRYESRMINRFDHFFTTRFIMEDLRNTGLLDTVKFHQVEFPLINGNCKSEVYTYHLIKKENCIYFTHLGMFYDKIRKPEVLVELFKKLPENYILVVSCPNTDLIMKYEDELPGRIVSLGLLSREDTAAVASQTDFNISFNNSIRNVIPSKFFECIDSGVPFINICQIPDCPTLSYLSGYEMVYTVRTYEDLDVNGLTGFVDTHLGKRMDREEILYRYKRCTAEYVANQIRECVGLGTEGYVL